MFLVGGNIADAPAQWRGFRNAIGIPSHLDGKLRLGIDPITEAPLIIVLPVKIP